MTDISEQPIKKDSDIFRIILQILTSVIIIGYIALHILELLSFKKEYFSPTYLIHLLLFFLLIMGFLISFKNTLVTGIIFIIWYILIITIGKAASDEKHILAMMYFGITLGIPFLVLGVCFIVNWFQKKSKWD